MAKSQPDSNDRRLLTLLEGQSCPYCTDGKLERGVYKDNRAMVCDSCETPHVQLWQPAEY